MKKLSFIIVLVFIIPGLFGFTLYSQSEKNYSPDAEFKFHKQLDNGKEVEIVDQLLSDNYLGESIARKYYILQKLYTYEEEGSATSPVTKTIVEKPSVYYSLKKLNRYYKKMVKKDRMERDKAVEELKHFLNIGISIVYQPTKEFEEYLDDHRKPEEIVEAYSNVVLE